MNGDHGADQHRMRSERTDHPTERSEENHILELGFYDAD